MKSAGRCRFTDKRGFCTNADMQGGGFRCLGPDCGGREPISGPKSDARIQQQADNSKKKEPKMKRPTYVMKKIALADCKPHADAARRFGCSREHLSKVLHGKRKANERIARGLRLMGVEVEVA